MEDFNLKKFLAENKLTKDSKAARKNYLKESQNSVSLSDEARTMVEDAIQEYTAEDLAEWPETFIDLIVEALEVVDGHNVPQGLATDRLATQFERIVGMFHSGRLPLDQAVSKVVKVAMNPANYENS